MIYLFWAATRGRCFTASVASRKQRSRCKLVASLDDKFPTSSTVTQIFRAVRFEQLSSELNLDPKQNRIRQLSDSRGRGDGDILAFAGCCNIYSLSLRGKKKNWWHVFICSMDATLPPQPEQKESCHVRTAHQRLHWLLHCCFNSVMLFILFLTPPKKKSMSHFFFLLWHVGGLSLWSSTIKSFSFSSWASRVVRERGKWTRYFCSM